MRHAVIKFTNTASVVLFGLLVVLMPRTSDPDLAPPAPIEFVSAPAAKVWVSKITPIEKTHHTVWKVEFSDGEKQVLWPCKYEDSRHCYWQADVMGNGTGRTFIHTRQRLWWVNYYAN